MTNLTIVTIENEAGTRVIRIRSDRTPEHAHGVLGPTVLIGCGMIDGVYSQSGDAPDMETENGMGPD
ncbi:MAG TPA: hypothetical protein VIK52_01605 [Opitutaceae bacterium]